MPQHAPRGPRKSKHPVDHTDPYIHVGPKGGISQRCTATLRKSGRPCQLPAIRGAMVCRLHGGNAPQVRAAAAYRLYEASLAMMPLANQTLQALLTRDDFPSTQLGAVSQVKRDHENYLDRTEGKPNQSLAVTGADGGALVVKVEKPW